MEIELKYQIDNENTAKAIAEDSGLCAYKIDGTDQKLDMKAVYFDTEDGLLQKNFIAFRIRKEGARNIATLKWGGQQDGSCHMREELNINIGSGDFPKTPDLNMFSQSEIGEKIIEIVGEKSLLPLMDINITREKWQAEDDGTIVEFCFDTGEVLTSEGTDLIREMEIELITGSEDKLMVLGEKLSEKYDLKAEKRSKYERGLALLNKINK